MQEYQDLSEFYQKNPAEKGDCHDLIYMPGYRISRYQESKEVIAVGEKVILLGIIDDDDYIYAAKGAAQARLDKGPYDNITIEELAQEVARISGNRELQEKTFKEYQAIENQRDQIRYLGNKSSYRVVKVDSLVDCCVNS